MSDGRPLLPEGSPFELWDVRLMSGDLKMTLDELDAAFEEGRIDHRTLVRRRGTVRWETLGKMAGLDGHDAPVSEIVSVETTPMPEPVAHVSSLPPPVTLSAREPAPSPTLGEETVDAIEGLRPRRGRTRLFAAVFLAALLGGVVVTAVKFPSLPARVTTALHREETPAPPSAQELPPSPSALPVTPSASVAPSARPAIRLPGSNDHPPPAAHSAARTVVAPARSAAPRSRSGAKPGASHASK